MANEVIVYGATWCPDCRRAKQFLGEHRIHYKWVNIEDDSAARAYVEQVNNGMRIVPTIVFEDGDILTEPTNQQLADKLGLISKAEKTFYDLIIIGGGPAGLTAGIYTTREGLDTLIIEKGVLGGQIGMTQHLDNVPGFDEGVSGEELAERLARQATRFGGETLEAQAVTEIKRNGQYLNVVLENGDDYCAKSVLITTGSKYRRLNVPGESELIGANIHFCATCDGAFYKDKDVLVVGGGNSGFEESLFLTRFAKSIKIVEFMPQVKASKILQDKVASSPQISVVTNHAVREFKRTDDNRLAGVVVENRESGELVEWNPEGAFIFVGLEPNTGFLPQEISINRYGFVETDHTLMTTLPGVFAAGDVRDGSTKQVAAAAGEGATAALMIRNYLERIGDGSVPASPSEAAD